MSSGLGYPDWQKIQQWIGAPLDEATGAAIGAGAINLGPYNLASWASIVVAIKPTGGKVTITVKQKLNGGPATLELDEVFIVNAASTLFEAVVLFGDVVSVTLQGDTVGETVDYAVYPSNTTTNAQVITNATVNVQHNDALVAAEQTLDFQDAAAGVPGDVFSVVDDAPNTRVKVGSTSRQIGAQVGEANMGITNDGAWHTVTNWANPATYDTSGYYNAGATDRLTVPAGCGGHHIIVVHGEWSASVSNGVCRILVNGSIVGYCTPAVVVSGGASIVDGSAIANLAAGDVIQVQAFVQTVGVSVSLRFAAERL